MCFAPGMRKPMQSRKLLVASVGVATINYVAACVHEPATSGNLVAPPPSSAGTPANTAEGGVLVAGGTAGTGGESAIPPTSGNLVAPPPTATSPTPLPTSQTPLPTSPTPAPTSPTPLPTTSTPPTSGNLMPPPKPLPTGGVKPPTKGH